MKKEISFGQLVNFFPAPVVLVTTKSSGKDNIVTIAWCGIVCSQPPMLSISVRPSRFSSELIKNSGEFVVNIPSEKFLEEVDKAGMISGKDNDKFELLKFKKEQAKKVAAPIIADCAIALECKLKQTVSLGTHDCFIAEIVCVQADSKIVMENRIDFFKLKPLVLLGPEYWNLGEKLEDYGFSKK